MEAACNPFPPEASMQRLFLPASAPLFAEAERRKSGTHLFVGFIFHSIFCCEERLAEIPKGLESPFDRGGEEIPKGDPFGGSPFGVLFCLFDYVPYHLAISEHKSVESFTSASCLSQNRWIQTRPHLHDEREQRGQKEGAEGGKDADAAMLPPIV